MTSYKKDLFFKIIVVGDFGVGKTSIVRRYADNKSYESRYKLTIGADFLIKEITWDEKTNVTLHLWDIPGLERCGYLTSTYYKHAVAALIVFDLTRPNTFKSVNKWLLDLKQNINVDEKFPIILLANKCDQTSDSIPTEIQRYCKQNNILAWFMTSARDDICIDEAMFTLTKKILLNYNNSIYQELICLKGKNLEQSKRRIPCCLIS